MPDTNFPLFALEKDPMMVRSLISKHYPGAEFDTPAGNWARAEIVSKGLFKKRAVATFNHDPSYYAEPGWSQQLGGMAGFFSRGESNPRQEFVINQIIPRFTFSIACIFHEAPTERDFAFLSELCRELGGFLFSGESLLDSYGKEVLRVDGYSDPEASFPQQLYVSPPESPVTTEEARARALALGALVMRGTLERDFESMEAPDKNHQELLRWVKNRGVEPILEPAEKRAIDTKPGEMEMQQAIDALWQVEGLELLAWALGLKDLPNPDEISDVDSVLHLIRLWDSAENSAVETAELRPVVELERQQSVQLAIHWRLREYSLRPTPIDFTEFVRKAKFGPLSLEGVELINGDLALNGRPLSEAGEEVIGMASSIARERHRAINWLLWGGSWTETDSST